MDGSLFPHSVSSKTIICFLYTLPECYKTVSYLLFLFGWRKEKQEKNQRFPLYKHLICTFHHIERKKRCSGKRKSECSYRSAATKEKATLTERKKFSFPIVCLHKRQASISKDEINKTDLVSARERP